jgi:hypothetical protein
MPVGGEYTEQGVYVNKYINITIRIHDVSLNRNALTSVLSIRSVASHGNFMLPK